MENDRTLQELVDGLEVIKNDFNLPVEYEDILADAIERLVILHEFVYANHPEKFDLT